MYKCSKCEEDFDEEYQAKICCLTDLDLLDKFYYLLDIKDLIMSNVPTKKEDRVLFFKKRLDRLISLTDSIYEFNSKVCSKHIFLFGKVKTNDIIIKKIIELSYVVKRNINVTNRKYLKYTKLTKYL